MDKNDFRIKKKEMTHPENRVYPVNPDSDKK